MTQGLAGLRRVQLLTGERVTCMCGDTIVGSDEPFDPMAQAWKDSRGQVFCTRGCAMSRKRAVSILLAAVI